nr:hypothetical protein [Tanacetum cinerariifolium]
MELESTQTSTTKKLPMLKQGDYEMWRLRIEQYFRVQDYALWDVIENGNSFKPVAQTTTNDAVSTANLSDANVYAFLANQPNGSQLVHEDLEQIYEDDLEEIDLNWQLALLSMRDKRFFQKTGKNITINGSDTAGYDKTKVECFNLNVEDTSSKAMMEIDGAGFDWSYMDNDEAPTNMAFMDFSDSELIESQITNNSKRGLGYVSYNAIPPPHTKRFSPPRIDLSHNGLPECAEPSVTSYEVKPIKVVTQTSSVKIFELVNDNNGAPLIEDWESKREDEVESPPKIKRKTVKPSMDKVEVDIPKQNDKPARRPVKYAEMYRTQRPRGNISYLIDFKEFDGGYVAFGRGAKGGKITGKGTIRTADESHVLLKVPRKNNMYNVDIKNIVPKKDLTCLVAKATNDKSMLWHKRLGHINFKTINKLVKDNLVRGLPSKRFENDQTCVACLKGKQHKVSFKSKIQNSISQPLFMLYMDLFGPTFLSSLMNKKYCLVVTDDFNRFTWLFFLATKDETSRILKSFITEIENLVDKKVKIIRCDNGIEFENSVMNKFCEEKDFKLPTIFWVEAVNTACYVQNRVLVVKPYFKTPYEMFRGRTPALGFMRPFGCHVIILNTLDHRGKFDGKSNEGFFVGYSTNSKAFRVYNTRTRKVEENLHIRMNYVPVIAKSDGDKKDNDGPSTKSEIDNQERPNAENSTKDVNTDGPAINTASLNINTASLTVSTVRQSDDFLGADNDMRSLNGVEVDISNIFTTYPVLTTPNTRIHKDHSLDNVIEKTHEDLHTCLFASFLSQEEPKRITSALKDPAWVKAMQEELLQFHLQKMEVKSAFLYGRIKEEVMCVNLQGLKTLTILIKSTRWRKLSMVCFKLQEPGMKPWPSIFWTMDFTEARLIKPCSSRDKKGDILLVQVYVDEIIFRSTKKELCIEFEELMHHKFQISSIGELTFFLELQVKQKSDGIFISQDKYIDEILRKFKYADVKTANTPMDKEKALLKDSDGDDVDVHLYWSMIGSLMYLTSSRPDIMFAVCTCAKF